jgi:hypothetical protein
MIFGLLAFISASQNTLTFVEHFQAAPSPVARSPSINIVSPPGGEAAENITSRRTPLSTPGLSEKGDDSAAFTPPGDRDDVPTPTTSPVQQRRRRSPSRSRSPPPPRRHRYDEAERRRTPPPMRGSPGRAPPPLLQAGGSGPPRPRPVVDMSVPPPGLMHSTSLPAVSGIVVQCTVHCTVHILRTVLYGTLSVLVVYIFENLL